MLADLVPKHSLQAWPHGKKKVPSDCCARWSEKTGPSLNGKSECLSRGLIGVGGGVVSAFTYTHHLARGHRTGSNNSGVEEYPREE